MLQLENVGKTYQEDDNFAVLSNVTLSVHDGEFVCVLGPSGCGKTVLLMLLAGLIMPTSGALTMNGQPITRPDRSRILMFQHNVLLPWKTVLSNVLFGMTNMDMSEKQKLEQALYYIDLVGLSQFKGWYTHKLSGGMQQRAALARSLAANPQVLLMDEPFSALDIDYRRFFRKTLERIWQMRKQTIVLVTHDIEDAVRLADTVYILTARPAMIKSVYHIDLERPRSRRGTQAADLESFSRRIKHDLAGEFNKSAGEPELDEQLLTQYQL
ncbi:MAG: ABC transporter ATP-binding protein [Patescibacteria group bacterium]|jgi:NitT/TauT family transport system ATP-binding protein